MSTSLSTPPSVAAQIAKLPELPMAEIRALWQKLVGGDTPTHNRQFLERRLAYRLQEAEFRKVDANLLDRNQRRIVSLVETGKVKKRDRDYRPAAGTATGGVIVVPLTGSLLLWRTAATRDSRRPWRLTIKASFHVVCKAAAK